MRFFKFDLHDSRLRDRFLISDPGLFRLRSAIRGTITVLLSSFVLWQLSEASHQPFILGLVGVMLAMNGSMVADDRTIREQKKTFLLIPIVAALALGIGVLISPSRAVVLIFLLAFTFGAIYVRQFGSRFTTLGGMAYTAFFSSIFFTIPQDEVLFVVEGILVAGCFAYAVKFWVVPDRAESAIRWSLSAYRAGLRRFVRESRRSLAAKKLDREKLRTRMVRVNELALLSEDSIVNASDSIPGSAALVRSFKESSSILSSRRAGSSNRSNSERESKLLPILILSNKDSQACGRMNKLSSQKKLRRRQHPPSIFYRPAN